MNKKFQEKDVISVFHTLLHQAKKKCLHGEYDEALKTIEIAARWAYNFNSFYSDSNAESLLKSISDKCIKRKQVSAKRERFVLIDSEGLDNRGLTQQYLRALEANHLEFLYISLRSNLSPLKETIKEVNSSLYGHVLTFEGKSLSLLEKAKCICNAVVEFQASRCLLHLMPWDVVSLISIYSLKGIKSYNINLTDHAFWLGSSFIDFNVEFRPYGKTVSLQKRGIDSSKILELPYYPIRPVSGGFYGLPSVHSDDVIIFTGGAPYKMEDDKNTFFLKIIDGILDISNRVVVFVAGFSTDSKSFNTKTEMMRNKERIYNIGIRSDINEVYRHCDIYLQTYPLYGGLMTQYAVINKIPILAYVEKERQNQYNGIINHFGEASKCFDDFVNFINYAKKLIDDKKFRKAEGEKCCRVMMNEERFNQMLPEVIINHKIFFNWPLTDVDYTSSSRRYISLEILNDFKAIKMLINEFGFFKCLWLFPKHWRLLIYSLNRRMIIYELKVWAYSLIHFYK